MRGGRARRPWPWQAAGFLVCGMCSLVSVSSLGAQQGPDSIVSVSHEEATGSRPWFGVSAFVADVGVMAGVRAPLGSDDRVGLEAWGALPVSVDYGVFAADVVAHRGGLRVGAGVGGSVYSGGVAVGVGPQVGLQRVFDRRRVVALNYRVYFMRGDALPVLALEVR